MNASANLRKLGNVADNDVVKKTVYDKLVIKVNTIHNKISSTSGLVTKQSMIQTNSVLRRRLKMLTKR